MPDVRIYRLLPENCVFALKCKQRNPYAKSIEIRKNSKPKGYSHTILQSKGWPDCACIEVPVFICQTNYQAYPTHFHQILSSQFVHFCL